MQVDGGVIAGYLKSGREILFIRAVADKRAVNDSLGEADDKVVFEVDRLAAHMHIGGRKESAARLVIAVFAAALDGQDGEIIAVRFAVIQPNYRPSLGRRKLKVALRAQETQLHRIRGEHGLLGSVARPAVARGRAYRAALRHEHKRAVIRYPRRGLMGQPHPLKAAARGVIIPPLVGVRLRRERSHSERELHERQRIAV